MKVDTKSWHYQWVMWWRAELMQTKENPWVPPPNLCSYINWMVFTPLFCAATATVVAIGLTVTVGWLAVMFIQWVWETPAVQLSVAMGLCYFVVAWTMDQLAQSWKETTPSHVTAPHLPNPLVEYLRARKQRMCPLIEYMEAK